MRLGTGTEDASIEPTTPDLFQNRNHGITQQDALLELFQQSDSENELTENYYEVSAATTAGASGHDRKSQSIGRGSYENKITAGGGSAVVTTPSMMTGGSKKNKFFLPVPGTC